MTNIPRYDFHIHTKYLGCANATMEVNAIVKECARIGVTKIGITDHLNTLDKLELHLPIRRDIQQLSPNIDVYFGVELNFLGLDGDFAFSAEIKERYGFQFVIGGIHGLYLDTYDPKKLVDIQHRHHLKACRDPLVDVLVHPYNFTKNEFVGRGWPDFTDIRVVPESYVRELGQTARETGTAIEIHPKCLERYGERYLGFLSTIAAEGACFSLCSDAHDIGTLEKVKSTWSAAEQLALTPDRIWIPGCPPLKKALSS